MRWPSVRSGLIVLLFPFILSPELSLNTSAQEEEPWRPPRTGLGYDLDLNRPLEELPRPVRSSELRSRKPQPLYVRVLFSWKRIELFPGLFHWDDLDQVVDAHVRAGFEVILAPRGGNPLYGSPTLPAPDQEAYLQMWKSFLRRVADRFRGQVRYYQISEAPDLPGALPEGRGAREYAFLIKMGAVEIRAVDPEALIVSGSIAGSNPDFLEAVLGEDLEAYLDAVALRGDAETDPGPALERASEILLRYDPSASLWWVGQRLPDPPESKGRIPKEGVAGEGFWETAPLPEEFIGPPPPPPETPPGQADLPLRANAMIRHYASALAAGSHLTLFDLRRGPRGFPELAGVQILLRRLFPPSVGPSPDGAMSIQFLTGAAGTPIQTDAWKFFDASKFQVLLVYAAKDPSLSLPTATIILDTADVTGAVVDDLVANTEDPVQGLLPDPSTETTQVAAPLRSDPLMLRYQRFATAGFLKDLEEVEVGGKREISAEEIIARHQQFQADQDSRLKSIMGKGKVSYHYKVADADITVDVTTLNDFYWDREIGAEWEQKEFYFNGVKWKGKKPPELPLIQPEKVLVLPLDINLNKDYAYRYLGTEIVEGRDCYVLEFTPVTDERSLYKGKVWIDRLRYSKVRVSSVQTGLEPPVISNDERDTYAPAPGTEAYPIWVLQRIDGQQIYSTSGVNLVVLREVEFSDIVLNDPGFSERRRTAHAGENTILRDTDEGFRYLDRDETGARVVRDGTTKSTTMGLGGVFYTQDLDFPIPLAGINHFDFNFRGTGAQTNLFFAGALVQASIQNPHLFGTRLDTGANLFAVAFSSVDSFFVGDEELEALEVRNRTQSLSVNVGYPLGNFFKVKATGSLEYAQYGGDDDTEDTFEVPVDTAVTTVEAEGEFNRSGYSIQAGYAHSRRNRWEPWGANPGREDDLPCDPSGPSGPPGTSFCDFDSDQRTYARIGAQISKQFILPLFQKLTVRGEYLSGYDLDRFSKYQFSFFGTRLRGFSGSGVRFDRGGIAAFTYSFNLGEVLRFEATIDHARVRDTELHRLNSNLGNFQDFTGFGLAGNFLGPWNTVVRFDYGIAVNSDIPGLRGDQEIQLLFLKFF